ncbi:hypothetical protein JCM3770_005679 [Rhodotorula araucariae]
MLFRRKTRVQCWYCSTRLHLLRPAATQSARAKGKARAEPDHGAPGPVAIGTRDDFWCGECGQITRKDQNGEVVSEHAAFFDSHLNGDSFAKRASPNRHRLPSSFPSTTTTPFCRQCIANQSLQLHLLASYPSDSDSDPESADFPPLDEYRRSLDARYPLMCAACAPAVEGTIRERDYRVKSQALGWRLRESQRARDREERTSEERRRREGRRWVVEGWAWRARGVAWVLTGVATAGAGGCYLLDWTCSSAHLPSAITSYSYLAVPLAFTSLLWSFWDPTWGQLRLERARGRNMGVQWRREYLTVQALAYIARLVGAALIQFRVVSAGSSAHLIAAATVFCTTLIALFSALYLPRLKPPPAIRLKSHPPLASSGGGTSGRPLFPADPLEPLAHLSLSRPGSLLVPSPPATPTAPHGRGESPLGSAAAGAAAPPTRPRLPSLSLRPWVVWRSPPATAAGAAGRDAPQQAMDVDVAPSSSAGAAAVCDDDDNSMDWTPLPAAAQQSPPRKRAQAQAQHVTFARQRFVPPDLREPTGLEGVFERVVAVRDGEGAQSQRMEGVELANANEARGPGWWKGWLG